jgi:glycosyltransferase involved in cell wall biosynthesis
MSVAPVTPGPGGAAAPAAASAPLAPLAPVSVVVLTKNEGHNIAECLAGLSFTDDIVVLDSYSTDRTVEVARSFANVRVYQREFDTEYKQRNYALHEIEYRHDWVYICDADERVPDDLARELAQKAGAAAGPPAGEVTAYRVRYRNMYMGRWIKHASSYPVWIIRFVRPQRVTYEVRETNVHPIVDGTIGELKNHFVHYSFNGGLARWLAKHNYYSTREALEGVRIRTKGRPPWRELWNKDPMVRRRTMKNWSYFLVGRGLWRFLHQYVLKLGFLDGAAGFHYCMMIAMYEYWIELKMRECEADWRGATDRKTRQMVSGNGVHGGGAGQGAAA